MQLFNTDHPPKVVALLTDENNSFKKMIYLCLFKQSSSINSIIVIVIFFKTRIQIHQIQITFHYKPFSIAEHMIKLILFFLLLTLTLTHVCPKGQVLCSNQQCHSATYIQGCYIYAPDHTCSECEHNYRLSNGQCIYAPQEPSQSCCLQFDQQSRCIRCANGLLHNPNNGFCQDRKIEGCLKKTAEGCEVCGEGYELTHSICLKQVSNCVSYTRSGECTACHPNSDLVKGQCIPKVDPPAIPHCLSRYQYGCASCEQGYRVDLTDGSCKPATIPGCLKYNPDGVCISCLSPHYLLYEGNCAVAGCSQYQGSQCIACQSSLGFQLTNGICEIDNCIYFTNKGCSLCKSGLEAGSWGCRKPSEKVCVICKADEYRGGDGKCYKKNPHCTAYQSGVCVNCCDGYYLDPSRQCQKVEYGCIYQNGICARCTSPFTLQNNRCVILGCKQWNQSGCQRCDERLTLSKGICILPNCETIQDFRCVNCLSGYVLQSNGVCIREDPNCEVRNSFNKCMKCKQNYQFGKDGFCQSIKFGCNYVDGRCTSCRAPFIYVPESESCTIDGCTEYFLGGCKECQSGYKLLYNSCKLPNCLISSNGKCIECDPDFIFTSDGRCVSKDEYCEKFDISGKCLKCTSTHYYSQIQQKCIKKEPGCIYDNKDNCIKCDTPFQFDEGRCVVPGCLHYFEQGCYQCSYPFTRNKEYTCEIPHCAKYYQGKCQGCADGYTLSRENLCTLDDDFCLSYDSLRTECLRCKKGYRVDKRGRCEYADKHCCEFNIFGECENCDRLYFINSYSKCQLRDPQCRAYTNGFCSECKPFYFVHQGGCMPNLKGCEVQQSYNKCLKCQSGYTMSSGKCTAAIKRLSWNDFDMDFFDSDDEKELEHNKEIFSVGVNNKLNLEPAWGENFSLFYSSCSFNSFSVEIDGKGNNGWSPSGSSVNSFVGIKSSTLQTYYALDIRSLQGSQLKKFAVEYTLDGSSWKRVDIFTWNAQWSGSVKTFYFKPFQAYSVRIVVLDGTPNIRFQFYISSATALAHVEQRQADTYISKTVLETIGGLESGVETCNGGQGCWAGVETCEPRKISGFKIAYTKCDQGDRLTEVKIDYSVDGRAFECWNGCQAVPLEGDVFTFPQPVLAQKMRVHFAALTGQPTFGIQFQWLD